MGPPSSKRGGRHSNPLIRRVHLEHGLSGVTLHLTLDRRQLRHASLISLV